MVQAQRTSSNLRITEKERCGACCHKRSGWFDCTEPSLATLLKGNQGVQGAFALFRGGSRTANLLEPQQHGQSKVCSVLSQAFGVVRLYRTFSSFFLTGETRCAECWFKHREPPRTFSNHSITLVGYSYTPCSLCTPVG